MLEIVHWLAVAIVLVGGVMAGRRWLMWQRIKRTARRERSY